MTAAEGDIATLCVEVDHRDSENVPVSVNVTIEVLSQSTAEGTMQIDWHAK